jgi:hypothetical protein
MYGFFKRFSDKASISGHKKTIFEYFCGKLASCCEADISIGVHYHGQLTFFFSLETNPKIKK